MNFQTVRDLDLKKKRVLLRTDYNVSLLPDFKIGDDLRIKQTLPTLKYLLRQGCAVILMTHLGRPEGKESARYSLKPVEKDLERLLGRSVKLVTEYLEPEAQEVINRFRPGSVYLLENLRFYPGEEANDSQFARRLADWGEVYINDAFGVCHREHASIVGIPQHLPSAAGLLLEKEIKIIGRAVRHPKRPLVVIIGGAKAETKIPLIQSLLGKADFLLIDGGIGDTFLKAQGYEIGASLVDNRMVPKAKKLLRRAKTARARLVFADDVVIGKIKTGEYQGVVPVSQIPPHFEALDIGPKTEVKFGQIIEKAATIIWNGPMGVFEQPQFARGTNFIYQAVAANRDSLSIVGGGETITALPKEEYLETIDHVSTGGGAMLEFIEKGTLPGIEALKNSL